MNNLKVAPNASLTETEALDPMVTAFRKAQRSGNNVFLVEIKGVSYIFKCERGTLNKAVFYCYLLTAEGAIAAACQCDDNDL